MEGLVCRYLSLWTRRVIVPWQLHTSDQIHHLVLCWRSSVNMSTLLIHITRTLKRKYSSLTFTSGSLLGKRESLACSTHKLSTLPLSASGAVCEVESEWLYLHGTQRAFLVSRLRRTHHPTNQMLAVLISHAWRRSFRSRSPPVQYIALRWVSPVSRMASDTINHGLEGVSRSQ